jgi:N-acetylglutamate synthase-like GNAT family acetyltransferase
VRGLYFRKATERDVQAMAPLFTKRPVAERERRMRARFLADPGVWFVAAIGKEVVGCCQTVFPRPREAWLQWMRIAPKWQGEGIGGRFTDYVEEQALRRGAEVIRLNTRLDNERVHAMMSGRGYTERSRWTRLTGLQRDPTNKLLRLADAVYLTDDHEGVLNWLAGQVGYQMSFATVTCPSDFRKSVSLEGALLKELAQQGGSKKGIVVAEQEEEIAAVALYAVRGGELRVLQVVAETPDAGVAVVAGAVRIAKPGQRVSIQLAGAESALIKALFAHFRGGKSKRHDFYVFGKRV